MHFIKDKVLNAILITESVVFMLVLQYTYFFHSLPQFLHWICILHIPKIITLLCFFFKSASKSIIIFCLLYTKYILLQLLLIISGIIFFIRMLFYYLFRNKMKSDEIYLQLKKNLNNFFSEIQLFLFIVKIYDFNNDI